MKATGQTLFLTIPATGTFGPWRQSGTNFRVIETTDDFLVSMDGSPFVRASVGLPYDAPELDAFSELTFKNETGSAITATIYAGTLRTRDERKVVTVDGTVTAIIDPTENVVVTPTEGITVLTGAGVQVLTADATLYFQSLRLYPAKAVAAGLLTPNTGGDIYIGRSATYLPDKRATTDTDYPVIYDVPLGQRMALANLRIKGTAGDGWFWSFV